MIKIKNISKKFNSNIALDNVSFNICKNSIIGLVGENGAGKTTLMKILTGLIKLYDGEIEKNKELRVSKLIDGPAFYKNYTSIKNFRALGAYNGIAKENIDEIFSLFNLKEFGTKKFSQYSLGMKQRLGIAFAFLGNPDIIVLDEPLNSLDPKKVIEFINIFKKWKSENECSIFISSHILSHLDVLSDEVIFLSKGKIVQKSNISKDESIYIVKLSESNDLFHKYLIDNNIKILDSESMKNYKIQISSSNSEIIRKITKKFSVDEVYKDKNTIDSMFRKVEGIDYENY